MVSIAWFQSFRQTELKSLWPFLKGAPPTRLVVLTSPAEVMARGRKQFVQGSFFKSVSELAEVVEFKRLRPDEVRTMIASRLREEKIALEPEALDLLTQLLDGNRGGIESELAKLISYTGPEGTVTREIVARLCRGYQAYRIFDLADQIVAGNSELAMQMVDKLLADGLEPIPIGKELQLHFTNLYLVKGGQAPTGNRNWLVAAYRRQAAGYSIEQLEQVICDIAATDAEFRSGAIRPEAALQLLVVRLLGRMERRVG